MIMQIIDCNLLISGDEKNTIKIRNTANLEIIKSINDDFGFLYSGICDEN